MGNTPTWVTQEWPCQPGEKTQETKQKHPKHAKNCPQKCTLQEINISHLGKRKIIFEMDFSGDMLVPRRVYNRSPFSSSEIPPHKTNQPSNALKTHHWELWSGWWFQMCFIFTPTWRDDPFWLICFKWVETTNWCDVGEKIDCFLRASTWKIIQKNSNVTEEDPAAFAFLHHEVKD